MHHRRDVFVAIVLALGANVVQAADAGITAEKLIVVDRVAASGRAKVVFLSRDEAGIQGVVGGLATVELRYVGTGSAFGAFLLPKSSAWLPPHLGVSKYVNPEAPVGGAVKLALFKASKVAKIVAKALGDAPFLLDLFAGGEPSPITGIRITISFPKVFGVTSRYCSQFALDLGSTIAFKEIAGGAGRKLIAKNGVAAACDPQLCASHSPYDDGAEGPLGACGGVCPDDQVCVATLEPDVRPCECVDPAAPCGDALYPTCLGSCPLGEQCNSGFLGDCGCGPVGTRCELGDDYPACGGVCAAGLTCQPAPFFPSLCTCL